MNAVRKVAVLFGGPSAERSVSLDSGRAVWNALRQRGHAAELVDPAETPVAQVEWKRFDSAFIALHGTYGEDGQVQRELDELGVQYTGSNAVASELAFDKVRAKIAFRKSDVPTPTSHTINVDGEVECPLDLPVVVKPSRQGSSVGVTMVREIGQLQNAFDQCFRFGSEGLVETYIDGEEWTVGVIDDRCLVPIRIDPARGFYDYEAKYSDNRTGYHVAGDDIDAGFIQNLQTVARHACRAVGATGIVRVDLMVDRESQPWVLEVNTVPGFTSHSLIPKAAAAEGLTLGELCETALPPLELPCSKRLAG